MALKQIAGKTFYSQGSTNIGIYENVLIDSDIDPSHIKGLLTDLRTDHRTIDWILNTHAHPDHFAGNAYLAKKLDAKIMATKKQMIFMEEMRLLEHVTYCAKAPNVRSNYSIREIKNCRVDEIIGEKDLVINEKKFSFTPLEGHAFHQIGISTPDHVLFAGDVLMAEDQIDKYKVPVIVDVEEAFNNLSFIEKGDYRAYLFSHVPFLQDYQTLIDRNKSLLQEIGERILELCKDPIGRERITGRLSMEMELYQSFIQFGHVHITVGAYMTWLGDKKMVDYIMEDGIMKVVRK